MSIYDVHMYIHLISSNQKNNLYTSFYQYRGYCCILIFQIKRMSFIIFPSYYISILFYFYLVLKDTFTILTAQDTNRVQDTKDGYASITKYSPPHRRIAHETKCHDKDFYSNSEYYVLPCNAQCCFGQV